MKRIHPQTTSNYISVPQLDDQVKETNTNTVGRMHQSTISKGPLSLVQSEANQSFYQIIQRNKLRYIESYGQFTEMRFMENLSGLKPLSQKQELLDSFFNMYDDMVQNLIIIQNTVLQMNFDAPDFQNQHDMPATKMIDLLTKDIKTLEGMHLEVVYKSSLRFLETVLEALQLSTDYVAKVYQIDIRQWSQKCQNHISQFKSAKIGKENSSIWCCFQ